MKNAKDISKFLKSFNPSRDNLLSIISSVTTDYMLNYIAKADYGYGKERCYPILSKIRDYKIIDSSFYIIHEEIALTRWT